MTSFEYSAFRTSTTNHATGAVTVQYLTSRGLATSIIHGYGTASATVESKLYDQANNLTSATDGDGHTTRYGYDEHSNRTSMLDPSGHETRWTYDSTHDVETMTLPSGEVTTTHRDSHGDPEIIERPAPGSTVQKTKYTYDAHGNVESMKDPLNREWRYEYDTAGDRTVEVDPEGDKRTWGYNEDSQETSTVSPRGHVTGAAESSYRTTTERDAQGRPLKVTDPLLHKTIKEYDKAGNLTSVKDPTGRTTTYTYDPANRLTEITYSSGTTPTVKYEYNVNGDRTKMIDGTGTSTYEYDQLDRLVETKDGHANTAKYEYDLANEQTKITYPNTHSVARAYDSAGRLKSVTDWLTHTTNFAYDADSDLKTTTFPTGTSNVDTYAYDETGAMKEAKFAKGSETLASLIYTRGSDGQVKTATSSGLPGESSLTYTYDASIRLTKGAGVEYGYDAANNPTKIGSEHTYTYNSANELEKSKLGASTLATYTYDELGERTKTTPTTGPATTYAYNQANELTGVSRPHEGTTAAIEDTYTYNGEGLRASQTISSTTTYLAWDTAEKLPLILNDGTNSYIYGPAGLPVEQISSGGTISYLHHDEQDSTRLLTGSTGAKEASYTYDAYGNQTGHTGTTTPVGYNAQYTDPDTHLVYLRARYYDPATSQFLSVDPNVTQTREAYRYAADEPLSHSDPTGLTPWSPQVRRAIATCQQWKSGPDKNSSKDPFYHNQVLYHGCETLLHLPSEIFGTGHQARGHVGLRVTAGIAGASSVAFGVGTFVACEGATDAIGTAHCALATIPSIQAGLVALGYSILGH